MRRGLSLIQRALWWKLGMGSTSWPVGLMKMPGAGWSGNLEARPYSAHPSTDPTPTRHRAVKREVLGGAGGGSAHTASPSRDSSSAHKQSKLGIKTSRDPIPTIVGQTVFQTRRKTPRL
jgi:hypothetical protein